MITIIIVIIILLLCIIIIITSTLFLIVLTSWATVFTRFICSNPGLRRFCRRKLQNQLSSCKANWLKHNPKHPQMFQCAQSSANAPRVPSKTGHHGNTGHLSSSHCAQERRLPSGLVSTSDLKHNKKWRNTMHNTMHCMTKRPYFPRNSKHVETCAHSSCLPLTCWEEEQHGKRSTSGFAFCHVLPLFLRRMCHWVRLR